MLAFQLPRLPYTGTINFDWAGMCMGLTHQASYSDVAIPARVSTAFTRAYGFSRIERIAPVNNGRPGYLLAVNDEDPNNTYLVVAMEGLRSWMQVANFANGIGTESPGGGLDGKVNTRFAGYAQTVVSELLANDTFLSFWNFTWKPIIFTGFSLGAAVLEIVMRRLRRLHAFQRFALVRFASPRVGNSTWWRNLESGPHMRSYYCGADPIDIYPFSSPSLDTTLPSMWIPVAFVYEDSERNPERWTVQGDVDASPLYPGGVFQGIRMARALRQPMNADNPWFYHDQKMYRLMFMNLMCQTNNVRAARYRYLETTGDNQWGQFWAPGTRGLVDQMIVLADPQPDPVDPGIPVDLINEAARLAQQPERDTDVGAFGGGDFGGYEPPRTVVTPNATFPTVTQMRAAPSGAVMNPIMTGRRRRP